MKITLSIILLIIFTASCKKDCLKKDKCSPNTYESSFVVEQTLPSPTANVYYIDAENGKKKNNGKSENNAFKSIKQLKEITFVPGDQILFKRGQYHFGEFELKQSGTALNRIYISAYGTGNLPIIKSEDGSNLKSEKKAFFLNKANYVSILNLNIHGGGQAIVLSNASYSIVAGCRIGEKSESGIRATGEYTEGNGSNYGEIHHCLIYSGESGKLGDRQGTDGIQLFDGASNWVIHHNEFKAWTHSAMSIKQLKTLNSNNNNTIEHNLIDCSDVDYMRAFDITGGDNKCANNVIKKNTIKNQTVTSHIHGNNNTLAYNKFIGLQTSNATEQPWAIDFHVITNQIGQPEKDKLVCYNNKIYNNLIYNFSNGTGIRLLNAKNGAINKVHDNEIVNNIFFNVALPIEMDSEPTGTKIANNLFFNSSSSSQLLVNGTNYSLINFEALNGLYMNNIEMNPMFINSSINNFNLNATSPAINAGINVGLSSDFNNNPLNGLPDIGVLEL